LTNILVYRFDPCFPNKQAIATQLLREGLSTDSIRIPHQAVLEFMAVVTRVKIGTEPLEPFLWRLPAMGFQRNSNQPAPFDELAMSFAGHTFSRATALSSISWTFPESRYGTPCRS
jgi:hypothetical protein